MLLKKKNVSVESLVFVILVPSPPLPPSDCQLLEGKDVGHALLSASAKCLSRCRARSWPFTAAKPGRTPALAKPSFLYLPWPILRNNVQTLLHAFHVTTPPPPSPPGQSECFASAAMPRPHGRTRRDLSVADCFSAGEASAAARRVLIGWELRAARGGAASVTKGGSPARAPAAGAVSGQSKPSRRARHAEPQGQQECLLFLRAGEDPRSASARPARGSRGGRHPLLLCWLGGKAGGHRGPGSWAGGRAGGRRPRGGLRPRGPCHGEREPPVPRRANRRRNRRPGMSKHLPTGPGLSGLTAASLSSPPFNVPKLLREEEKEKYADMAREWRAAQGKDAGPLEKQVKAARRPGSFGKCWTRGWGRRARTAGASGWYRGGVRVSPGVSPQAP